jgi:hypothetical protein
MTGNPVYATSFGTGVTIAPEFARCTSNCMGGNNPTMMGARVILGLPIIQVGVGVGIYNPDFAVGGVDADKETTMEATVGMTVFGGPLIPISVRIQTGLGILKQGSPTDPVFGGEFSTFTVPIALGISVDIPTPGFNIEPWFAPRIQISREQATGFGLGSVITDNNLDLGFSLGVNGGLPMGLGFHAALDFLKDKAFSGFAGAVDESVVTFGIGIHYTFRLPNAPMVPGI